MVAPARSAPGRASQPWCRAAASSRGSAPGRDSTALAVVPAVQGAGRIHSCVPCTRGSWCDSFPARRCSVTQQAGWGPWGYLR